MLEGLIDEIFKISLFLPLRLLNLADFVEKLNLPAYIVYNRHNV